MSAQSGNELNYRIVTGATPRPESSSGYYASYRSSVSAEDVGKPVSRDKSRRSSPKSDNGYKIKYRRNRLRQKLRQLRGKALELSYEMAVHSSNADTSPQRSTRLRQMMNCYEKQIENVSKLLCKLSSPIPPASTDDIRIVDLDYEKTKLDEERERTAVDGENVAQMVNGVSVARQPANFSPSPSPSPEPPKLSPRSPIDYGKSKSPDKMRDSPPVLPRVYIAIQPTSLECIKQNLAAVKSWHGCGDDSSSSSIEKGVKGGVIDNTDRTIIRNDARYEPAVSPISSSEFEVPGNGAAEWDMGEPSPKLSSTLNPEGKIQEDTKTFYDVVDEPGRRSMPLIPTDDFLDSMMNIEIDGGDTKDTKEPAAVERCLDEVVTRVMETQAASKQMGPREEQSRSSETLLLTTATSPILEDTRTSTEHTVYDPEERVNGEGTTIASTFTQEAAQEVPTIVERPQAAASSVTNILQLQSNYYGSSVARDNVVFTGVIQNTRNAQKVSNLEKHFPNN